MRLGITAALTDLDVAPARMAAAVEARGFDSFWVPEHTHLPVDEDAPPALVQGVRLDDCVAYADNWSDRPLLQSVGEAVVVNPRRALVSLALANKWRIVYPEKPRSPKLSSVPVQS